jgi:general secretion pathway protein K
MTAFEVNKNGGLHLSVQQSRHKVSTNRQGGVALAIVVWFIAGMSLLVAGIVSHARVDTKMAQLHIARAKAAAAGDGAIQLMLADMTTGKAGLSVSKGLPSGEYRLGNIKVVVKLVPTAGLIDLNSVSGPILASLFAATGRLGPSEAQIIADNVIKWRSSKSRRVKFAAMEDLLRVDGVTRTLLDAIHDYIVVGGSGRRGTQWSLSSGAVLAIMQEANPKKAEEILRQRESLFEGVTEPGAEAGNRAILGDNLRADATVYYGDQAWLRRRWVSMKQAGVSQLPWHSRRVEAPRVIQTGIVPN